MMAPREETLFEVETFRVRRLLEVDAPLLRALGERCREHLELHYGFPPDPAQLVFDMLSDLPPGKELADKLGLGVIDVAGQLVGGIDLIRDYPEPREWYLGLMLLEPEHRGHGLGRKLFAALVQWLRGQGVDALRLAVAEDNEAGRRFWARAGFGPVKQVTAEFGKKQSLFHVMRRTLET